MIAERERQITGGIEKNDDSGEMKVLCEYDVSHPMPLISHNGNHDNSHKIRFPWNWRKS